MSTISLHRTTRPRRPTKPLWPCLLVSLASGAAAAFAPATLTGSPAIDVVERFLIASVLTFVGAYAHRWTWFVSALLIAIPARGPALGLVLLSVVIAIALSRSRKRSRNWGAVVVGLQWNAVFWLPSDTPLGIGPVVALISASILLISGAPELRRAHRRTLYAGIGTAAALAMAAVALAGFVAVSASPDIETGSAAARRALTLVREGETEQAARELETAERHLSMANDRVSLASAPVRVVPGAAQQAAAARTALDESLAITRAADDLLATNYDDLRYEGQLDLDLVADLTPRAERVAAVLGDAEEQLRTHDDTTLIPPLRNRLDDLIDDVAEARADAATATTFLAITPEMLGGSGTKRYLVAMLAPAELRGAGGFIGSFVELEATDGDVELTRSGRIAELITAAGRGERTLAGPQEYLDRYGRFRPQDYLQDVSMSPHWPSVGEVLHQLYPQSGGQEVDAVIGVNPSGLAALLELTGPVEVEGMDESLNAANAADFLNRRQYLEAGPRAEREELLEAATRATFEALTDASLPSPRLLGDVLGPVTRAGHLMIWSPVEDEQALFESVDASGSVHVPVGEDGFSVVQQNTGNSKIDAYLQRRVSYDTTIDASTGQLTATARIELHNAVPNLDLPAVVIGNNRGLPIGTSYTWLSFFTPHDITRARIADTDVNLGAGQEAGLRTWDTPFIAIAPGETVTIVLSMTGGVDLRDGYRFTYLPQPMVNPDEVTTRVTVREGTFVDGSRETKSLRTSGFVEEPLTVAAPVHR